MLAVFANWPRGQSGHLSFLKEAGFPFDFARNDGLRCQFEGTAPVIADLIFWGSLLTIVEFVKRRKHANDSDPKSEVTWE